MMLGFQVSDAVYQNPTKVMWFTKETVPYIVANLVLMNGEAKCIILQDGNRIALKSTQT